MDSIRIVSRRLAMVVTLLITCMGTSANEMYDSLEISLLTCAPHDEIYSLYGHTAIRVKDKSQGFDMVVNYGLFDSSAPNFVLRFIFGLTDYSMGITSFEIFRQEYAYYGSQVTQQTLDLTEEEKAHIMEAISVNSLPENVVYRYNYFYDNCTTRARDMLADHLSGEVRYKDHKEGTTTFRNLVHECTAHHPWARFGNDMLLGLQADKPIGVKEQQFLPRNLMRDFSDAEIVASDGTTRRLIKDESIVVPPGLTVEKSGGFPLSPLTCALILLAITVLVTVVELCTKKTFWVFDAILMVASGLAGILLFLMLFSEHPTVQVNLQLLLLNPLPLFFVYPVVKAMRRHRSHQWWRIWKVLIILFFIGGFFQKYAEGTYILALSLLIRIIMNVFKRKDHAKSKKDN